ncbi:MAG: hypothetical protein WCI41_03390 [bacterium]
MQKNIKFIYALLAITVFASGLVFVIQNKMDKNDKEINIQNTGIIDNKFKNGNQPNSDFKIAHFKDKTAYIKEKDGKNYAILVINGKEKIVKEADIYTGDPDNSSEYSESFDGVNFSPNGNYLIIGSSAYEWDGEIIYDINKGKIVLTASGNTKDFTPDEKYYYNCEFSGEFGNTGNIYATPDFNVVYDIYKHDDNENYDYIDCEYNDIKKVVTFILSKEGDYDSEGNKLPNKKKVIEYSLIDNKARTIK